MPAFFSAVADEDRIHRQLDRLAGRAHGRRIESLAQDGVRFTSILEARDRVVRLLAGALGDGSFRPGIAHVGQALLGGKPREIGRASALDHLAHAVVAEVLSETLAPRLSPHLWSYRAGRSAWQAVRQVARYARAHVRSHADPKSRGLVVLRSDVASYTDEIPVADGALLWDDLRAAGDLDPRALAMVQALVRPLVSRRDGGEPARRERGVLFGLPTTPVIANLYLSSLDDALGVGARERGHYARFGDDVVFVSPARADVDDARATLERIVTARGLRLNAKKLRLLAWNGAARPSVADRDLPASAHVVFLGASIGFDGTIGLPPAKWSALVADLRGRIRRTVHLLGRETNPQADLEARAKLLVAVVNDALDPRSSLATPYAPLLLDLVSDRGQLKALDHLVATFIAEAATGRRGPRAFREASPGALRDEGLVSRVVARNRGLRHRELRT